MKVFLLSVLVLLGIRSFAQDYHHWSEHFGVRATLLGGAATAGLGDNGSVYYNPAAMAWVEDPNLSVSVNAYKVRTISVKNALGEGLNLSQTSLETYPNLIAGIVRLKSKPKLSFGYAVITKKTFNSNFDYLHQAEYDVIDTLPGLENYVASYNYNHKVLEYWAGGGVSYKLGTRWSIGFSHFGIYKNVDYSNNIDINVLPGDSTLGSVSNVTSKIDFNYWDVKGNFKPSVNFNSEGFRFGLAWTTPTFHIMGRGNVFREFGFSGLPNQGNTDVVFVDRREKIKVSTKEFGSLAIGISIRFGSKAWLHFSHETFFQTPYYTLFNPSNDITTYPTIADTSLYSTFGDQNFLAYGEATKPLTNFGVGYEVRFTDRWNMLIGIRTDINYLRPTERYYTFRRIQIESSKWDLTHGSLGFGYLTKSNKKWTVGIDYSYLVPTPFKQFINFTEPSDSLFLSGKPAGPLDVGAAKASQFSLKLVVGIEFGSLDPIKSKGGEGLKEEEEE